VQKIKHLEKNIICSWCMLKNSDIYG